MVIESIHFGSGFISPSISLLFMGLRIHMINFACSSSSPRPPPNVCTRSLVCVDCRRYHKEMKYSFSYMQDLCDHKRIYIMPQIFFTNQAMPFLLRSLWNVCWNDDRGEEKMRAFNDESSRFYEKAIKYHLS